MRYRLRAEFKKENGLILACSALRPLLGEKAISIRSAFAKTAVFIDFDDESLEARIRELLAESSPAISGRWYNYFDSRIPA